LPAGEAITVAVKLQTLGTEQVSGLEKRPMAATLRVGALTETYDPNSPNDVWVGIWGGVRVYLLLMVRD
jgi:hypothetical protein